MSALDFLSPDRAAPEAAWRSPLARALAGAPAEVVDVTRTGKIEVRGDLDGLDVDAEIVRITPERALVLCPWEETGAVRDRLREQADFVVDMSAAYAGLRLEGEAVLRRLTDLDLEALPAVGALAHIQALVLRDDAETFRAYFPQEYSDYVAEVVLDALEGLR